MASRDTTPQLVIQDGSLRFDFAAQTAASAAPQRLVGDRYFATTPAPGSVFRRSIFSEASTDRQDLPESQNWRETTQTPSGDCSGDEDDDYDEDDDDGDDDCDEVDEEAGTLVAANHFSLDNNGIANSSDGVRNRVSEKMSNAYAKFHSSVGSSREKLAKDNGLVPSVGDDASERPIESHQHGRATNYHGTVTTAEPQDTHHLQFLQGPEGQKEFMVENGRSFRGGKDVADLSEPGESLRAILSDPFTGTLMDDAMILPCGHSFGSNGLQQVLRMKACFTCSQPMTEDSVAPNLSLRAAVQAFLREEASVLCRASKKRRFDQDRGNYGDAYFDQPRGRGVQFPLAVADRVIIKGNKRTPLRFVGREAIVTTQCLNGWYVVKTLDSAESVKLQYRSLAKITDHSSSSWPSSSSKTSSWL